MTDLSVYITNMQNNKVEVIPDIRPVYEDGLGYEFGYKDGDIFRFCFHRSEIKPEFINELKERIKHEQGKRIDDQT